METFLFQTLADVSTFANVVNALAATAAALIGYLSYRLMKRQSERR